MTTAGRDGSSGVGDREVGSAQVAARRHLMERGARDVPRPPWVPQGMPLDDATLIRYAMWRANSGAGLDVPADLYAALQLIESARAELDGLETGLLFVSRAEGLTWPQIAERLGVRSPQAAQQRFERVSQRAGGTS